MQQTLERRLFVAKRNYNGEGTVYYSAKLDRYIAQFTDPYSKKRKSLYGRTEKEAKKKLREAINKAENGGYVDRNNVTIPELAEKIIEQKHNANITGSSAYLRALGSLNVIKKSNIADIPIQRISRDDLQDFFNSLKGYSNSYISKIHQLVKLTFSTAIDEELIVKNPMAKVLKPRSDKMDKKVEALTLEQHKAFISSLEKENYKNIFFIAINTGMRIGEILALKSNDIDFMNKVIHVDKTITRNDFDSYTLKKSTKTYAGMRDIPFDTKLEEVLKDAIKKQEENEFDLIFSMNQRIIRPSTLNIVFKRICKNLKFEGDYNFHMLRHTFATRCIEAGMPAHVLQKLLGHSDVSITINTYTSIFDKYKKDEFEKYLEYKKQNGLF